MCLCAGVFLCEDCVRVCLILNRQVLSPNCSSRSRSTTWRARYFGDLGWVFCFFFPLFSLSFTFCKSPWTLFIIASKWTTMRPNILCNQESGSTVYSESFRHFEWGTKWRLNNLVHFKTFFCAVLYLFSVSYASYCWGYFNHYTHLKMAYLVEDALLQ